MSEPPRPAHDEILAGTDRARIHRFSLLAAIAWGFFTVSHALAGRWLMTVLHGTAFVVSSVGAAIAYSKLPWRERASLPLVAGGSLVSLIAIATVTGGSDAPAMGFAALVPLVTGLMRSPTERRVWLAVSLLGIASIPLVHAVVPVSLEEPVTLAHRLVAALGLATLLYLWGAEWRASSDRQAALLDARARTIEAQADEIRSARDAAVHASEQKSRYVAMTSHELRGPLNGILGMSHALADTQLTPAQRELVRALSTSAGSLSALLADLLDLARIEAGRLDVVLAPTEIRELMADVVDVCAPAASAKGLDVAAIAEADVPVLVSADAGRLAQVLRNLVSNAVKFTETGTVVVEARREGSALVISVADTGRGMRDEDVKRIFAPFEQVSADLVDRRAGTGLGLWISRQIVERWGGTIDVTSAIGRGTTFRVTVPIDGAAPVTSRPPLSRARPVVALGARPITARALVSATAELGIGLTLRTGAIGADLHDARAVIVDVASLDPESLASLARLDLGTRLILAATAARIAECERLAAPIHARVLLLPVRARRLAHALDALPAEPRAPLRGTMLVVDDDAINRRVARHAAEQLGLDVAEAATADEAIAILEERSIEVALLDLHLDGDRGDVLAVRLRALFGDETPALLAYTGTVVEADRRRLADAGVREVLGKPLDRAAFDAAIGRALHARRRAGRSLPPAPPSAFEADALGELAKVLGDRAAARELVEEFLPELERRASAISTAAADADLVRVEAESHRLASMAATFGARKLATVARGLESASRTRSLDRVRSLGAELEAARTEATPLLRAWLAAS